MLSASQHLKDNFQLWFAYKPFFCTVSCMWLKNFSLCMISILCSFAPDMQSFLMPPNYFDDGYLAIFLRQLSRRGLLLFYCSQKLTELDTPISFPLSFVPPLYTQKMLQEKIASEKIIIALSYFCQTRYQEN